MRLEEVDSGQIREGKNCCKIQNQRTVKPLEKEEITVAFWYTVISTKNNNFFFIVILLLLFNNNN